MLTIRRFFSLISTRTPVTTLPGTVKQGQEHKWYPGRHACPGYHTRKETMHPHLGLADPRVLSQPLNCCQTLLFQEVYLSASRIFSRILDAGRLHRHQHDRNSVFIFLSVGGGSRKIITFDKINIFLGVPFFWKNPLPFARNFSEKGGGVG